MSGFLSELASDFSAQLQAAFIGFCLLLLMFVFYLPARRRRLQKKMSSLRRRSLEFEPDPDDLTPAARFMAWLRRPGEGALLMLIVLIGTAVCALIGWRIPAEIERAFGDGGAFALLMPEVTLPAIGKAAQIVGLATFGAIALRSLRVVVPATVVALLVVGALLAIEYVTGVRVLGLIAAV